MSRGLLKSLRSKSAIRRKNLEFVQTHISCVYCTNFVVNLHQVHSLLHDYPLACMLDFCKENFILSAFLEIELQAPYEIKNDRFSPFVHQPETCTIVLCLSLSLSVDASPCHRVRHRMFIFGIHMHTCPVCMHIKYLVILTCIF